MSSDQLTNIRHIGKVTAKLLQEDGYTSFADITQLSKEQWLTYRNAREDEYAEMIASAQRMAERRQLLDAGMQEEEIENLPQTAAQAVFEYARGLRGQNRPLTRIMARRAMIANDKGVISEDGYNNAVTQAQPATAPGEPGRIRIAGLPHGAKSAAPKHIPEAFTAGLHHDNSGWTSLGPHNVGGRTRTILVDPTTVDLPFEERRIWIGSVGGGIWRTDNGGRKWFPTHDLMANLAVCALVMGPDPEDETQHICYAGTGESFLALGDGIPGNGIYVSKDGWSWSLIPDTQVTDSNKDFEYVMDLAIAQDGRTLLATTGRGIFLLNWENSQWNIFHAYIATSVGRYFFPGIGDTLEVFDFCSCISIDPDNNQNAIAGGRFGKAKFSTNGGQEWHDAVFSGGLSADAERVQLCYAAQDSSIVYASVYLGGNTTSEIWKSTDGGQNYSLLTAKLAAHTGNDPWWDQRSVTGGMLGDQGNYDNAIWAGDPTDADLILVGGINLFRSTDGGANFEPISTWWDKDSVHSDHHAIVADAAYDGDSNRRVLFGNDGGIYTAANVYTVGRNPFHLTAPFTDGWEKLNNDYSVTQLYYGAGNARKRIILGGAQDNGTWAHSPGNHHWDRDDVGGGDGFGVAADPNDPTIYYGTTQYLGIFRATRTEITNADGTKEGIWNAANPNQNPWPIGGSIVENDKPFISQFVLDPVNSQIMYVCGNNLWRTNNAKAASVVWQNVKPAPSNGRAGWTKTVTAIAVAHTESLTGGDLRSNTILTGHGTGEIYLTHEANKSAVDVSSSWREIGQGTDKPNAKRYCLSVAIHPQKPKDVFYAGFGGFQQLGEPGNIWRTDDGGDTWQDISGGRIMAPVHAITMHPQKPSWIYAATEIGLFASEDEGNTWSATNEGPANVACYDLFWLGTTLVCVTHGRGMFQIDLDLTDAKAALVVDTAGSLYVVDATFGNHSSLQISPGGSSLSGILTMKEPHSLADIMGTAVANIIKGQAFLGDGQGHIYAVNTLAEPYTSRHIASVQGEIDAVPQLWHHPDTQDLWLLIATSTGKLSAFNVIDALQGTTPVMGMEWIDLDFPETSLIHSLAIMDNWAYIGSNQGVCAVQLLGNHTVRWHKPELVCLAPILIASSMLFIPHSQGITALDARTGTERWSYSASGAINTHPAFVIGAVVIGTDDGQTIGLDYQNGNQLFDLPQQVAPIRALGADDNELFVTTQAQQGMLLAFEILPSQDDVWKANQLWDTEITGGVSIPPIVVKDSEKSTLFVITNDNQLIAYNAEDGGLIWANPASIGVTLKRSPSIAWTEA